MWSFFTFRFIGGIGIGISTIAAPLFISEISPAGDRGKLTGLFQFNIVFGILMAFFSNFVIIKIAPETTAWRWMLGIQVVPSVIYTLMCFYLPESPRWLIVDKKDEAEGKRVFALINPKMSAKEIDDLVISVKESALKDTNKTQAGKFFCRRLRYPILFAFLIAAFNQLSGINIILYFAPRLLGLAGMENPVTASVALGVTNLIATFIGIRLIDLLGRKTLLFIGCIGYILSLSVCTYAFFHYDELKVVSAATNTANAASKLIDMDAKVIYFTPEDKVKAEQDFMQAKQELVKITSETKYEGTRATFDGLNVVEIRTQAQEISAKASAALGEVSTVVLVCMIVFIASHAIGSGTIIWVFVSEIFPNDARAKGQSLGSFTHWIFAAGLTLVFPMAIANFDAGYIFGFFAFMMILQFLWCTFMMPETKGKTLEQIGAELSAK